MSLRRFVNTLLAPTKYRLCTAGEQKALARATRSPFEAVARREPPGAVQTIFDVGANVGQTTTELRRWFPQAAIHAFEPTPASREQYLQRHGQDPRARLWPCAIASQPGRATFHLNRRSMTNSLLTVAASSAQWVGQDNVTNVDRIEVELRTLDHFCAEHQITQIDILKLDIQGSELDALRGARGLLERKAIRYICLEAPFVLLYEKQASFQEISEFLAPFGCPLYGLFKLAVHESDRLLFADALFFCER